MQTTTKKLMHELKDIWGKYKSLLKVKDKPTVIITVLFIAVLLYFILNAIFTRPQGYDFYYNHAEQVIDFDAAVENEVNPYLNEQMREDADFYNEMLLGETSQEGSAYKDFQKQEHNPAIMSHKKIHSYVLQHEEDVRSVGGITSLDDLEQKAIKTPVTNAEYREQLLENLKKHPDSDGLVDEISAEPFDDENIVK